MRDYMIRKEQAAAERSAAPCKDCGHPHSQHRELEREVWSIEDGAIKVTPNPDYEMMHFHCGVTGCTCVIVPEG